MITVVNFNSLVESCLLCKLFFLIENQNSFLEENQNGNDHFQIRITTSPHSIYKHASLISVLRSAALNARQEGSTRVRLTCAPSLSRSPFPHGRPGGRQRLVRRPRSQPRRVSYKKVGKSIDLDPWDFTVRPVLSWKRLFCR
jgi:hypothetical protein